jgi:Ca-activated chloride channel family protein
VSALDWAELGRDTVTWGQHLLSSNEAVPEGPVKDALAAVDIGERSDPKASDWPSLRSQLVELLKKKQDDQKKQDQKKDQQQNQDQNQDQQQNQQQSQNQKQDQQQQNQSQQQQNPSSSQPDNPQNSKGEPPRQPERQPSAQQKAFGDVNSPPPQSRDDSHQEMQKVGGMRKDQQNDPAQRDPQLAIPLEKLEQVKSQDQPAELFQMMRRSEPIPPETYKGPNW